MVGPPLVRLQSIPEVQERPVCATLMHLEPRALEPVDQALKRLRGVQDRPEMSSCPFLVR